MPFKPILLDIMASCLRDACRKGPYLRLNRAAQDSTSDKMENTVLLKPSFGGEALTPEVTKPRLRVWGLG